MKMFLLDTLFNNSLGSKAMTKLQRKACLAVSALASIGSKLYTDKVDSIVADIETWLKHHNKGMCDFTI